MNEFIKLIIEFILSTLIYGLVIWVTGLLFIAVLRLFLIGDTKLKAIDFTLMYEQREIMEKYLKILERRIENLEDFKRYETIILHHTGLIKK